MLLVLDEVALESCSTQVMVGAWVWGGGVGGTVAARVGGGGAFGAVRGGMGGCGGGGGGLQSVGVGYRVGKARCIR